MTDAAWKWDKTLFGGSARYYREGRLPYPAELATAFQEELGLDGSGRLLDVGCGTGQIALLLAPLYDEVIGIDADEEMIGEAREDARRLGRTNTRLLHARAEQLPLDLGVFRTATFAQSFHWMERERVAATVFEMLEPNGAWVHVDFKTLGVPATDEKLSHPEPPRQKIRELVASYLGPVKRAGQGTLPDGTPSGESDIMLAAGFAGPRRRVLGAKRVHERSENEIVASVFSASSSAPHLFGSRLVEFESELRAVLRRTSPDGRFNEVAPPGQLIIWTRPVADQDAPGDVRTPSSGIRRPATSNSIHGAPPGGGVGPHSHDLVVTAPERLEVVDQRFLRRTGVLERHSVAPRQNYIARSHLLFSHSPGTLPSRLPGKRDPLRV